MRQRLIALAAAYVIALSSLLASFGAARAEAQNAGQPGSLICHSLGARHAAPASDETNGKICVDCCCVGCLMLMAALPPPPLNAIAIAPSAAKIRHPVAIAVLSRALETKSHRSRAPPFGM